MYGRGESNFNESENTKADTTIANYKPKIRNELTSLFT